MTKEYFIEAAGKITPPSDYTGKQLRALAEVMASRLTSYMTERNDLEKLIGEGNYSVMVTNHENHFDYIGSQASIYDPVSFVETVIWVFRTYMSRGFTPEYWQIMLPEAIDILEDSLSNEQFLEAKPIYAWLYENIAEFVFLSESSTSFYENIGTFQGVLDDHE